MSLHQNKTSENFNLGSTFKYIGKPKVVNFLKLDGLAALVTYLPHGNSSLLQNSPLLYHSTLNAANLEPMFLIYKLLVGAKLL